MHAVVNRLTLGKPFDADLFDRIEGDLKPQLANQSGFLDFQIVRVSDQEVILLVWFATREALDEISSKVAGPWFADHVRPYLAGPVQRSVGEIVYPFPEPGDG